VSTVASIMPSMSVFSVVESGGDSS